MTQSAQDVARRSTCPTRPAGALLYTVFDERALGYEGSPAGYSHCKDQGCILKNDECQRAMRAELNAVLFAARQGLITEGSILVCTHPVVHDVIPVLVNAGVSEVICPPVGRVVYEAIIAARIKLTEKDEII